MKHGFAYTLTLEEPVLANSLAGDTNSARSLAFVPGGLIRGALINAYLNGKPPIDTKDDDFRRLFLSEKNLFLHAYPCDRSRRALPAPFVWRVHKDESMPEDDYDIDIYGFRAATPDDVKSEKVSFGFWWPKEQTVEVREIAYRFNLHTQRDAMRGRATEEHGAVFRYEALAAGLQVRGLVLAENAADANTLKALLEKGVLFLGKARSAGYGRARVEEVSTLRKDWREAPLWREDKNEDELLFEPPANVDDFILTFLSAALIRDENGQFTLDPIPALRARLGLSESEKLEALDIFRASEIVGGFNRKWGLPLPQAHAIAAGSVFVFKANPPIAWQRLEALLESGIGERRNEGFGRVTFDLVMPPKLRCRKIKPEPFESQNEGEPLSDTEEQVAKLMFRRIMRRELERRLLKAASEHKVEGAIANSQLSRWRILLRDTLATLRDDNLSEKRSRLSTFFAKEENQNRRSWQSMFRARIGQHQKQRLTDWIREVLTQSDSPWHIIGRPGELQLGALTASSFDDERLKMEYRIRLIDAVLAGRIRDNKSEQKQQAKEVPHERRR